MADEQEAPEPSRPRTIVYVDGLNLYYGAVEKTAYKWLDIPALCALMLPQNEIVHVNYFTARIKEHVINSGAVARQAVFLRALEAMPNLTVYYGRFQRTKKRRALVDPLPDGTTTCRVWNSEEKGSDVNIATRLLVDGFSGEFEVAALVSDDSDLKMPVEVVRAMGLGVVILSPRGNRSKDLAPAEIASPSGWYGIRPADLKRSQLPQIVLDRNGRALSRPLAWD